MVNSNFDLVKYDNWLKTVYLLSRFASVGTNLSQVVLFQAVSSDIW